MDNVHDITEVQPTQHQLGASNLVVKKLDPKTMTGDEMKALWMKVSTQDYAFDDDSRGSVQSFVLNLVAPASHHFLLNESGYAIVRNVYPGSDANIHLILWDRSFPFKSVIEAGRQVLEWLYLEQKINRVTGYIPKFNPLAERFAKIMGFKYEGTMRKAIKFKGEFQDVDIYGLLAKEFERRFQQ